MKTEQPRPIGRDPYTRKGISAALRKAWSGELMIDHAADAAFASSLRRLRGEPGSNGGNQ